VQAYEHVRGPQKVSAHAAAGAWAHAAVVEGAVPGSVVTNGDDWTLAVGAPHAERPLGLAPLDTLDGHFALVRYDARRDELQLVTDPFGMQALYVAERADRTYVSTSALVLARHLRAGLDPIGVAMLLRSGYQLGPRTCWEGVRRVEPATLLTFAPAGGREERTWLPVVDERVRRMTLDQTAELYVDTAIELLRRRFDGDEPVWVDLTGGFDSRTVVALLLAAKVPFIANTNGREGDADVELARQVSWVGGFPWRHFDLPEAWDLEQPQLNASVAWGDGRLDALQLGMVLGRHELKAQSGRVLLTGGGGEHTSAFPWLQEWLRAGQRRPANIDAAIRHRYLKTAATSILRSDPTPDVVEYMRTQLGQRARLYAAEPNTVQLDAVYAYKSVGHFGAYRSASEAHLRQEMVSYYRDVFSVTFSANHRWRSGHRLQRAVIERLDSRIASVPTTGGGPAQQLRLTNAAQFLPYYRRLAGSAVRKLRGASLPVPTDGAAQRGYRRAVRRLRDEGALSPGEMRTGHLYNSEALTAFIDRAEEPGFAAYSMLGRVVTLELAARATA
jgi:hypothetical protein